jgi:hypothetical protein
MNRYTDGKTVDPRKNGGVSFMGYFYGDVGSPSGTVTRARALAAVRRHRFPPLGRKSCPLPRTRYEETGKPTRTVKEKPGEQATTQKRSPAEFFSGHVAQPVTSMNR